MPVAKRPSDGVAPPPRPPFHVDQEKPITAVVALPIEPSMRCTADAATAFSTSSFEPPAGVCDASQLQPFVAAVRYVAARVSSMPVKTTAACASDIVAFAVAANVVTPPPDQPLPVRLVPSK